MIYYDVETVCNCFTLTARDDADGKWVFEISDRRNDFDALVEWLNFIADSGTEMWGFKNLSFDYLVIFYIYTRQLKDAASIYACAQAIIQAERHDQPLKEPVIFKQIDLYKIHHFDNKARLTGLKQLQFVMRLPRVMEMPFPHNVPISPENIPELLKYNDSDVLSTRDFANASADKIALRRTLSELYSPVFMNYSDSKLGKQIVIRELKKAGVYCYDKNGNARQTPRPDGIPVGRILLPSVSFKSHAFNKIKGDFSRMVIRQTKGADLGLEVNIKGVDFKFGFGGIHASVKRKIYRSNETHVIIDADVTSYYPNMSIRHGFYPEHLGEKFMEVYEALYNIRAEHKAAGRAQLSEAFKLGLNSVYGDSNEPFSPFFDPQMTMSITINGQLFLAMLCERLLWKPYFEIIQANTDGVTFYMPRDKVDEYHAICEQWQKETKLNLEFVEYKQMIVRDVNNYIAESNKGKIKLKGDYVCEPEWHKDHSFLCVQKAAVANLLHGADIAETIKNNGDIFDFLGFLKVDKSSKIRVNDTHYHGSSRYAITKNGHQIYKIMPPLGKDSESSRFSAAQDDMFGKPPPADRVSKIQAWRLGTVVNDLSKTILELDHDFYIKEAEKLTKVFKP